MREEFFLRSELSGLYSSAETWIAVAYVAGMFLILAFRPQQIGSIWYFRRSYMLFAAYLIVPSLINGSLWLTSLDGGPAVTRGVLGNSGLLTMAGFQLSSLLGKLLLGLSIFFALSSLTHARPAAFPMSHPPEIRD